MIYNDGFPVNDDMRFEKCPRCGNEEYSEYAQYCRVCGLPAFNECEGGEVYDNFGESMGFQIHRNAGNARFCEHCGKKTMLFKERILKPYEQVQMQDRMHELPDDEDDFLYDEGLPFN